MKRLALIFLAPAIASCAMGSMGAPSCHSDDDCGPNQLCFPEGCVNPSREVVAEVIVSGLTGYHAQDFLLPVVSSVQEIAAHEPFEVVGEFQLRTGPSPWQLASYAKPVTVQAQGASQLIPGLIRSYEGIFPNPDRGAFRLPIGAGKYTLTATAQDPALPPVTIPDVETFTSKTRTDVSFTFTERTVQLSGRLLKRYIPGFPDVEIPESTRMEVQVFDAAKGRALSQRTFVSTTTGDFTVFLDPTAESMGQLTLVATPKEPGALVPTKSFTLNAPFPQFPRLELGNYGEAQTRKAQLRDAQGAPVPQALVYLVGPVSGGGTFRTKTATTGADGTFSTDIFPSADGGSYTMYAFPPPGSRAGVLETKVVVSAGSAYPPFGPYVCPERRRVVGQVMRPDGLPAVRASVAVVPIERLENRPLPPATVEATTDDEGRFELYLDSAHWRIDVTPTDGLPVRSQFFKLQGFAVAQDAGVTGGTTPLNVELRAGQKVTGTVTMAKGTGRTPAPYALVRFFHVSRIDGRTYPVVLGQAVADQSGNYALTLPTAK